MKTISSFAVSLLLLASTSLVASDAMKERVVSKADMHHAAEAITAIQKQDPSIKKFFDKSCAYVIYPSVGEGALIVGGAHGKGLVYEKGSDGQFSLVGYSELTKVSAGLQAGGQSYREIVFFENKTAFADLKKGKAQLSAQASGVALKRGSASEAAYKDGVAVFLMPKKGVMGELSVGSQQMSYERAKRK